MVSATLGLLAPGAQNMTADHIGVLCRLAGWVSGCTRGWKRSASEVISGNKKGLQAGQGELGAACEQVQGQSVHPVHLLLYAWSMACRPAGLQAALPESEGGAACSIGGMRRQGVLSGLRAFPLSLAWCLGAA